MTRFWCSLFVACWFFVGCNLIDGEASVPVDPGPADTGTEEDATSNTLNQDEPDVPEDAGDNPTECEEGLIFDPLSDQCIPEFSPCDADPEFFGQIGEGLEVEHSGGTPGSQPFEHHSGIRSVFAALNDLASQGELARDANGFLEEVLLEPPVTISGAIITSTSFGDTARDRFWLGDVYGGLYVRRPHDPEVDAEPTQVRVGQEISMTVTRIGFFNDNPQVVAFTGFELLSEGNSVHVIEPDGELSIDDYGRIVKVSGTLRPDPWECGISRCWFMSYGEDHEFTTTYRTTSQFQDSGDCITYVGPISAYPGMYSEALREAQLDVINFDWARRSLD
jgi:hypothetical protein